MKELCPRLPVWKLFAIAVFFIQGCASTEMKGYLGEDIREVMLTNGPPIGVIDMGNGTRAFQFMWGSSSSTGVSMQNSAKVTDEWFGEAKLESAGNAVVSSGCIVAYLTRWDRVSKSWVVYDYRIPKKLVC